jgi:hypothetical protein
VHNCAGHHCAGHGCGGARCAGEWETHLERLQRRFNEAGVQVCGQPYAAPRIIFWNLREVRDHTPRLVLEGKERALVEEERLDARGHATAVFASATPYETLRQALDAEAFDVVRAAIGDVGEGPFAEYEFETADGFTVAG